MSWCNGLEEICRADVPLREHTWYGLGGPARWFVTPRHEEELSAVLVRCTEHGIPWRMLGRGANVLVRDEGFDGVVIRLSGPAWETIGFDDSRAHAGGGADFPKLVKETASRGLAGLEGLAGIPGTVGGAVRMNAGGRHGSVSQFVRGVRLMMPDGSCCFRDAGEMGFAYRSSKLDGAIVVTATFELQPGDPAVVMERFQQVWNEKRATQPPMSAKSAGCVFKNPPGQAAGALIDQAGLKGHRCGAAEISTRHANFILAYPGATAQNVLDLIALAKERVHERTGIELELEVEVW